MSPAFDERIPMPEVADSLFFIALRPTCGLLTSACVDAAWGAVVALLQEHAEREAATVTLLAAVKEAKRA